MYDFEKVLLKPNIEPLDSNTQRVRRNLIVTSVIAFFLSIGSSGIDSKNSSFAGIKFNGLQVEAIQLLIFLALLYFIIHFVWASLEHLNENRLRLTGVAIPMVRGVARMGSAHTLEPNTSEASQSTIYSWWKNQMTLTDEYVRLIKDIEKNINDNKHETAINSISTRIDELVYKSAYIHEAMKRYEAGFWHHQRSQLLRWILLDFGLPFAIGVISLILTFVKLLPFIQAYASA
ncbi:hypothetical protein K0J45_09615 [Shewanella alkalitolerans]|uniref:hypothetical protein n=1 Tax=Shewanella alkalitolerans TaxID=2864209 RepID=UPI001C658A73|nr:hypothetical protein [Shewanella alkalitolerans]QYJ99424.1 hypothetical protein K0J45_09615 [Shewanella alkalitolerans]